jgi:hypothetical protein
MEDETVIEDQPATERPVGGTTPAEAWTNRSTHIAIIVAILVAAILAESFLLFRGNTTERSRADALEVSRRFLVQLTTYDASTLDVQRRGVLALATGKFRGQYEQLTGSGFLATLREREAKQTGTVVRAAVTSLDGDTATVLSIVQLSVTNKDLKTPKVEQDAIELTLVHTKSGWRIDSVDILGALTG